LVLACRRRCLGIERKGSLSTETTDEEPVALFGTLDTKILIAGLTSKGGRRFGMSLADRVDHFESHVSGPIETAL
jgi:hypothetical protein